VYYGNFQTDKIRTNSPLAFSKFKEDYKLPYIVLLVKFLQPLKLLLDSKLYFYSSWKIYFNQNGLGIENILKTNPFAHPSAITIYTVILHQFKSLG